MIFTFYIILCILNTQRCTGLIYHKQSNPCSGDTIVEFTTNVALVCVKECLNNILCDGFNLHVNEVDAVSRYTCELLQNVSLNQTFDGPYASSVCYGMFLNLKHIFNCL